MESSFSTRFINVDTSAIHIENTYSTIHESLIWLHNGVHLEGYHGNSTLTISSADATGLYGIYQCFLSLRAGSGFEVQTLLTRYLPYGEWRVCSLWHHRIANLCEDFIYQLFMQEWYNIICKYASKTKIDIKNLFDINNLFSYLNNDLCFEKFSHIINDCITFLCSDVNIIAIGLLFKNQRHSNVEIMLILAGLSNPPEISNIFDVPRRSSEGFKSAVKVEWTPPFYTGGVRESLVFAIHITSLYGPLPTQTATGNSTIVFLEPFLDHEVLVTVISGEDHITVSENSHVYNFYNQDTCIGQSVIYCKRYHRRRSLSTDPLLNTRVSVDFPTRMYQF